jgi:hypothetical protein
MPNTTTPALESIDIEALLFVSGGCHKRSCCCPQQQQQQCIINMPPAQPQVLPQVAQGQPPTDPSLGQPFPSTMVTTNVSINGQPVGGQPTAAA